MYVLIFVCGCASCVTSRVFVYVYINTHVCTTGLVAVCCSVLRCVEENLGCWWWACERLRNGWQRSKSPSTHCNILQHTGTHSNTLQHTATHCNTLERTATHCNTLHHTASHPLTYVCATGIVDEQTSTQEETGNAQKVSLNTLQHAATHCNTLQHTATHCSTLHHITTHPLTWVCETGIVDEQTSAQGEIGNARSVPWCQCSAPTR